MNFKKGLRGIGLFLVFVGIFIIIIQPLSTTGAVIDLSTAISRIWFFIGLGLILIGVSILFSGRTYKGDFYITLSLDEIMEKYGREKDTVFVLDSSGVINYQKDIRRLIDHYPGGVYIPKSIVDELKKNRRLTRKLKDFHEAKQIDPRENYSQYKTLIRIARNALEKSRKHEDYLKLIRIVKDEIAPAGMSNRELDFYQKKIEEELIPKLRKNRQEPTKENQVELLKREYRVSKGDLDVLTTALKNASNKKKTEIIVEDTHISDAVNIILDKYPKLGKYLECVSFREYQ